MHTLGPVSQYAHNAGCILRGCASEGLTEADIDLDRRVGAALMQRGRQIEPQRPERRVIAETQAHPVEKSAADAHRSGGLSSMPNTLVKRTADAVGYGKMGTSFRSTRPGAAVSYCHRSVVWWLPSFCRSSPARAAVQLGGA